MLGTVIVINLDRDVARMAHMRAELMRAGLNGERFAALRGDQLPPWIAPYFAGAPPLSPGEIGCYASHLEIMRRIAAGEIAGPVLVLEDDVELARGFAAQIDEILRAAPKGWDLIRLSHATKRVMQTVSRLSNGRRLVRYSRVPTSTGGYLISVSGARKFLREQRRRLPVDQDLRRVWAWDLDTYGVEPPPIRRDIFDQSSIDDASPPSWRDSAVRLRMRREAMAREGMLRARRCLQEFGLRRWAMLMPLDLLVRAAPRGLRPVALRLTSDLLASPQQRGSTAQSTSGNGASGLPSITV